MTIGALRRLLDEIDTQGGPDAARHNRLHLPDAQEGPDLMSQPVPQLTSIRTPDLAAAAEPKPIPVAQLLKWGDEHADPEVQDQAARARIALHGLRQRHAADQELAAIDSEEEQLAKRLAELRARKAELAPAKAKKQRKPVDYSAAEVRAWAKGQGIDCPATGRVPKGVVDAWRAARPEAG
ncbi:Lsr2 family DNA-binding protein [Streptomyces luteogriseus]|uniref:Lsr2 family DNA-binding protein n=1 Tax=Streptomyces luteogriseus TaxID=68233 RepID=UPI0037B88A77